MSSTQTTDDPLAAPRRRRNVVGGVAAVLLAATASWSLWPLPEAHYKFIEAVQATEPRADRPPPLNLAAFGAPVWDPAPPPPKPTAVAAAPPPPPLRLQLLGIAREEDAPGSSMARNAGQKAAADTAPSFVAAVYDETNDRILLLRAGDPVVGGRVGTITSDALSITDTRGTRTLALRQPTVLPRIERAATESERKGAPSRQP